ncbi:MAG: hypothetical protein ACKVZH_23215 [Blastocatellia bacterium]
MLKLDEALVQFKLDILKRAMPARSAVVFGDMYIVEGGYTAACLELGCEWALLVDSLETPNWQNLRIKYPALDFYKGDFSNHLFMKSFNRTFDIGVLYDIVLHQAPLLNTLHLMLEKVRDKVCIVQPMLIEQQHPNSLVYLPGNTAHKELYPMGDWDKEYLAFDVKAVNQCNWIWGMTISFLTSVLQGEGFEITYQEKLGDMPNNSWFWWGCVAERKSHNPQHWANTGMLPGLQSPSW